MLPADARFLSPNQWLPLFWSLLTFHTWFLSIPLPTPTETRDYSGCLQSCTKFFGLYLYMVWDYGSPCILLYGPPEDYDLQFGNHCYKSSQVSMLLIGRLNFLTYCKEFVLFTLNSCPLTLPLSLAREPSLSTCSSSITNLSRDSVSSIFLFHFEDNLSSRIYIYYVVCGSNPLQTVRVQCSVASHN